MTVYAPDAGWAGPGLLHEGCIFDSDDDLLERCVPFIREGLSLSQPVVVFATAASRRLLVGALGPDADRLAAVIASDDAWRGGHRILLFWDQLLAGLTAGGQPCRVVAEPAWLAEAEGQEWHRFESAVNDFYVDLPCYSLCLHDRRRMADDVLVQVTRTHPVICDGGRPYRSPDYVVPAEYVPAHEPPWSTIPAGVMAVAVPGASEGRAAVTATMLQLGLEARLDDVLVAVTEIVVNSLEAGGRPAVAAWGTPEGAVVEITDEAGGGIDPLAGYRPPGFVEESGRGLWLARALADDTAVRSGPWGSAVRMWFGPTPA